MLVISVNSMDKSGNHHLNVHDNVFLTRLSEDGEPLANAIKESAILSCAVSFPFVIFDISNTSDVGEDDRAPDIDLSKEDTENPDDCLTCYGAETPEIPCCNTCAQVQAAYRKKGWAFTDAAKIAQVLSNRCALAVYSLIVCERRIFREFKASSEGGLQRQGLHESRSCCW